VEEMIVSQNFAMKTNCKVSWENLCTNCELWEWFESKRRPRSLNGKLTRPAVYRFLLPNEDAGPRRCYIGETECLGRRIGEHLTKQKIKGQESDKKAIWPCYQKNKIYGALTNLAHQPKLMCELSVEELIIGGGYLLGVPVDQHSLDSSFARKMFENIEILRAKNVDKFNLLNDEVTVSAKSFCKMALNASVKLV
jgi:hypothetical protein